MTVLAIAAALALAACNLYFDDDDAGRTVPPDAGVDVDADNDGGSHVPDGGGSGCDGGGAPDAGVPDAAPADGGGGPHDGGCC